MSGPIKPDDVTQKKTSTIPDVVFDAFNETIAKHWDGRVARFEQREVVALITAKGISSTDAYAKKYLDVEESYRAVGWSVEYDRPGYNETYEPTFTFQRRMR